MASKTLGELRALFGAPALDGSEFAHVEQAGDSRASTLAELAAFILGPGSEELIRDTIAAALVPGKAITIAADDAANTITIAAVQEWAPNVTGDADVYIPAAEAMTIAQGNAPIGTADISFEASTAAAPGTFAAAVLPVALEAGAWLKVSFANVVTFAATHLVRAA